MYVETLSSLCQYLTQVSLSSKFLRYRKRENVYGFNLLINNEKSTKTIQGKTDRIRHSQFIDGNNRIRLDKGDVTKNYKNYQYSK